MGGGYGRLLIGKEWSWSKVGSSSSVISDVML